MRIAERALADLSDELSTYTEKTISLPKHWKPTALVLTPNGCFVASGRTIYQISDVDGPQIVCNADEELVALAWSPSRGLLAASRGGVFSVSSNTVTKVFQVQGLDRGYIVSLAASEERIWVGDAGHRKVWILDARGRHIADFGPRTATYEGLVVPSPHLDVLALTGGGFANVNPGRHRLEIRDCDGRLLETIGREGMSLDGFAGCCNPTDAAALPRGGFATLEKGLQRIKLLAPDGQFLELVADGSSFSPSLGGGDLQCDSEGRIWFLDAQAHKIRIFVKEAR